MKNYNYARLQFIDNSYMFIMNKHENICKDQNTVISLINHYTHIYVTGYNIQGLKFT